MLRLFGGFVLNVEMSGEHPSLIGQKDMVVISVQPQEERSRKKILFSPGEDALIRNGVCLIGTMKQMSTVQSTIPTAAEK